MSRLIRVRSHRNDGHQAHGVAVVPRPDPRLKDWCHDARGWRTGGGKGRSSWAHHEFVSICWRQRWSARCPGADVSEQALLKRVSRWLPRSPGQSWPCRRSMGLGRCVYAGSVRNPASSLCPSRLEKNARSQPMRIRALTRHRARRKSGRGPRRRNKGPKEVQQNKTRTM